MLARCLQHFSLNRHLKFVTYKEKRPAIQCDPAFALVEMVGVIAVLVILFTASARLISGTGSQARKAGVDLLAGMVEQARTAAIISRKHVILAVAEPGDLPAGDERCRLGLFKVETWPENATDAVEGILMSRWRTLETGIALIGGEVNGVENPLDAPELAISYGANKLLTIKVHAIAFNSRGGLHHPSGSTPVALRVAEGGYRDGKAAPNCRSDTASVSENRLKIGRVIARAYRID